MAFRPAATAGVAVFALSLCIAKSSQADSSASIALRGIVPPRAAVAFDTGAGSGAIELAQAVRAGTAVVNLSSMGNSTARVKLSLIASTAATRATPTLLAADGAMIPYRVRYNGQDLDFANGEAVLADGADNASGMTRSLEVLAPQAAHVVKDYAGNLTVVVTAR